MTLTPESHIAIAGAGLSGRLLAWRLLEAGYQVVLYDAGSFEQPPAAAYTAAGMISPVSEAIDTEPLMYHMGVASLAQWPQWLEQLNQSLPAQAAVDYQQQGSVIVAHSHDVSLLQQYQQDMQLHLPENTDAQWLDKKQLHMMETDIADHFQQGLLFAEEAHIDNRQLLRSLFLRIEQLGGKCIANTEVAVVDNTLVVDETVTAFDLVIDCRGVGAKPQWSEVRGVRGEILRVQTDEVRLSRPVRLLHPRYQLYVVPKMNNEYVIGATQIESEDRSPVSVQSALELNSALYTLNPAFAEARIIEMQSNLRPSLNDNRPKIQYDEYTIRVNGLYRHGYLLAPVVVQHVLALLGDTTAENNFGDVLYEKTTHQGEYRAHAIV